ncbi:MAG TPA: glycosyltransferase family 9 protein, partial [Candidatus Limnocylindria bacterium]|nr:glycosyltransferase family 9 protein [Candidatus Limnocylindria bacterium]
ASDGALLNEIASAAGRGAWAIHHLSIGALAALHERARVVVGMDSGALHLAAAVGAPVVGLYGPFGADRVAPLGPVTRVRAIWRSLPCSPCGTLEAPPCGASHDPPCLLAVSVEDVIQSAVELDGMSDAVGRAWLPPDSSIGALGT